MQNDRFFREGKMSGLVLRALLLPIFFLATTSFQNEKRVTRPCPPAVVTPKPFYGYTFLDPEIINKNAAYAPFLVRWDDYYERYYFTRDIQKEENIKEWIERFCDQPTVEEVNDIVYVSTPNELAGLYNAASDPDKKTPLPYRFSGNSFAEILAVSSCTEVISYLMFAKRCEDHVLPIGDGWQIPERDIESMMLLVDEGLGRFRDTESQFVRMRYAYQLVRLAHYARDWQYTVDLYNYLMPKIERKRYSIVFYWTLGHLAGALQKLGRYPEAAWRYSLIFRNCPSKRAQAYRSFVIRNDKDWEETLRLCQNDAEKSTLYILRAGGSRNWAASEMQQIYELDPANPQLDLLLVSDVQELEKIYLRTGVTDQKQGIAQGGLRRDAAARHLLELQKFVRRVVREAKTPNPKLWRAISGYLELMAGDRYAADKSFKRVERALDEDEPDDQRLFRQIEIWRLLLEIMNLDPASDQVDNLAFRIRSYEAFKLNPNFEPFLQDWLSAGYAANAHPGKAILAAYPPTALGLNPRLDVIDDLLALAATKDPILLERTMQIDTNPDRIRAQLLEIKGAYLIRIGQPEAALVTLRAIALKEDTLLPKFSPFREKVGERIHRPVSDSLVLNRREIAQKLINFEFRAKAAQAVGDSNAARYWYIIGLGYYNMSYFGYEWEAVDFHRDWRNQLRLGQGPVFPLRGSPHGNHENTDLSLALSYFERALQTAQSREMAARAAFMAARCQQKQWFCDPDCTYRPGSQLIPTLPERYSTYYDLLISKYADTRFFGAVVKECKWLAAYAR